jgi:hypothetical protein
MVRRIRHGTVRSGVASEALFFVRTLKPAALGGSASATVRVSPDGMAWCDEGTVLSLRGDAGQTFCRVGHFGGWLRLSGRLSPGETLTVTVYLVLKE